MSCAAAPAPGPDGDPETAISGGPRDKLTPGSPVTLTRHLGFCLQSSEPANFRCALNGRQIDCRPGTNVLPGRLKPGRQLLVAQAVDQDSRFDRTPAQLVFYVPLNLKPTKSWRKVRSRGSYAGDYVATGRPGAVLLLGPVKGVHELRLFAPTGPRLGTIAVRIGHGRWRTIDLRAKRSRQLKVFEVRPPGSRPASGVIQIKALTVPRGGVVAVDALVAR